MDRVTIKENAKKMIVGNKWYIWKPMVWFMLAMFCVGFVCGILDVVLKTNEVITNIVSSLAGLLGSIVGVGYAYYCLQFVRGNRIDAKEVFVFAKDHWVVALLTAILVGLNVAIGMILLIIPGIIAALGLSLYTYVVADNPELSTSEALKKCWNITKGYKVDLLVFFLSFIGWMFLAGLTLGILMIWLMPYMTIAETLVYESLKK